MLEIIITSSLLIVALILLRRLWRNKISRRMQYTLWLLAALRLLVPVTIFENPFNVMNVLQAVAGEEGQSAQSTDGGLRIAYYRESSDEKEKGTGKSEDGLTAEEFIRRQRQDGTVLAENGNEQGNPDSRQYQGKQQNPEEAALEAPGKENEDILSRKELEYLLEGGSLLNRFFVKGYGRYTWYLGMAALGTWILGCNLVFRRRIYKNRICLGREGGLAVYQTEEIDAPCLLGILRPAIYLTKETADHPRHKEHAVLHELTHYRHRDHIWALVRSLCLVIYWFDPLVWLAAYLSARDCEMACDEGVTEKVGEEGSREYGCTLIEMAASGGRGTGLLRCATGLSVRKRELKSRISWIASGKRRTGILGVLLVAVCGILLAACTLGGSKKEEKLGRYVESEVELSGSGGEYWGLAQNGGDIQLAAAAGRDMLLKSGTEEFAEVGAEELSQRRPTYVASDGNGARVLLQYEKSDSGADPIPRSYLITEVGEEIRLETLENHFASFFYSHEWFYVYDMTAGSYYRLDPATGEMEFLLESSNYTYYITGDETCLYLAGNAGVQIFDLEKGELKAEQDYVLSGFVAERYTSSAMMPLMLCPYQDGIYILTQQGMYWHKLYDEVVELVIDGSLCSMGDAGRSFTALAVRETDEKPEFYVLYDGKELMRYTYDATLPAVPDMLRVYSVYEDSQVSMAVNAFRREHPDIPVLYEVGMNAVYGATLDDVLKNLATEIAAGNGPDILIMDDIPFDSYAEKGALADLSALREEMTGEKYFTNVIDAFAREGKQYAIPMTFAVPVLAGKGELLEGVESLADLADLLERERETGEADYVFCTWDAESTLRLLAQSSQGAWMRGGEFEREAVEEFLTQAKRIYDVQFSVQEEPEKRGDFRYTLSHVSLRPGLWTGDYSQYPLARRFDSDGLYCMADKVRWVMEDDSLYAGFMSGGERDYMLLMGIMKLHEDSYVSMPGQQYGTCLASSLLAINAGTKRGEESRMFLEYALSAEFLSENALNGTPVNREAYLAKQKAKEEEKYLQGGLEVTTESGNVILYEMDWPTQEDYRKLTAMLDGVTGVNLCDTVMYEAVAELGQKALTGEQSIEEALDAIEKRVKIYLAE